MLSRHCLLAPAMHRRAGRRCLPHTVVRSAYSGYMPGKKISKIEVVFTPHRNVLMEVDGKVVEVDIPPGGTFTRTRQAASLLRLGEFSDWVAIYIDDLVGDTFPNWHPHARPIFRPTFSGGRRFELKPDIQLLSIAHILRRACVGAASISDVEADTVGASACCDEMARSDTGQPQSSHQGQTRQNIRVRRGEVGGSNPAVGPR